MVGTSAGTLRSTAAVDVSLRRGWTVSHSAAVLLLQTNQRNDLIDAAGHNTTLPQPHVSLIVPQIIVLFSYLTACIVSSSTSVRAVAVFLALQVFTFGKPAQPVPCGH